MPPKAQCALTTAEFIAIARPQIFKVNMKPKEFHSDKYGFSGFAVSKVSIAGSENSQQAGKTHDFTVQLSCNGNIIGTPDSSSLPTAEFLKKAEAFELEASLEPVEFSTGSVGWAATVDKKIDVDGKAMFLQVNLNAIIRGSKPDSAAGIVDAELPEVEKAKETLASVFEVIGEAMQEAKDDLKKITGIGPVIEQRLNTLGINTIRQIAKLPSREAEQILCEAVRYFPSCSASKVLADDWVLQAQRLKKMPLTRKPFAEGTNDAENGVAGQEGTKRKSAGGNSETGDEPDNSQKRRRAKVQCPLKFSEFLRTAKSHEFSITLEPKAFSGRGGFGWHGAGPQQIEFPAEVPDSGDGQARKAMVSLSCTANVKGSETQDSAFCAGLNSEKFLETAEPIEVALSGRPCEFSNGGIGYTGFHIVTKQVGGADICIQISLIATVQGSTGTADDKPVDDGLNEIDDEAMAEHLQVMGIATVAQRDDLKQLKGVGPCTETRLNKVGIFSFSQLTKMTQEAADALGEAIRYFPGRINEDGWAKLASELA